MKTGSISNLKRVLVSQKKKQIKMINGYKIVYNSYFNFYEVSHDNIGVVGHYDKLKDAINHCKKG